MRIVTGRDQIEVSGRTYVGIAIRAFLRHTTANTAFTGMPINLDNLRIRNTLFYGSGRKVDCINDQIQPIVLAANYDLAGFKSAYPLGTVAWKTLVAAASGVDSEIMISANIPFSHPVNCTKGRVAEIAADISSGFYGSTVDTSASYVEVDFIEGDGLSQYVPLFRVLSIPGAETSRSRVLGDWVEKVHFINTDTSALIEENSILAKVNVSGDKISDINDTYQDLLAKRDSRFELSANADARGQCFEVLRMQAAVLNKCNVNFSFNAANVAGGKNFIVTQHAYTDSVLTQITQQAYSQHVRENAALI